MSLRERLRRRGNAAGSGATSGSGAQTAATNPPAARADVRPGAGTTDEAAAVMAALEVEVPIDLSTELLLAAAVTKPVAERSAAPSLGTAADAAPLSAVDQLKLDVHRRLIDRLDLEALEKITDERQLTLQIREAVTEFLRAENAPLSAS
jgi:hypothetical protein